MRIQGKKAFAVILLASIVVASASIQIKNTESIDPFFTLVARGFNPQHMDILFLIRQQLSFIGINIDPILTAMPEGDATKIRNYDLAIIEFQNNSFEDPFFSEFYTENGTMNVSGYETELDWEIDLENGKNQWYIETGLQMTPNDSLERIEFCWEWQNYLLDDVLSSLPLFVSVNNRSHFFLLAFNLREVRPVLGSRMASPGYAFKSQGLGLKKAITYAIDREEIRNVVLGNGFEINHYPISPMMSNWLNPNIVKYCHDLTAARDFMTTVGFDSCWRPEEYVGYGSWPNWEDVYSKNMITIKYAGFDIWVTSLSLIVIIVFVFYKKWRKPRK